VYGWIHPEYSQGGLWYNCYFTPINSIVDVISILIYDFVPRATFEHRYTFPSHKLRFILIIITVQDHNIRTLRERAPTEIYFVRKRNEIVNNGITFLVKIVSTSALTTAAVLTQPFPMTGRDSIIASAYEQSYPSELGFANDGDTSRDLRAVRVEAYRAKKKSYETRMRCSFEVPRMC
jgi:hypothetical protein